MTQSQWEDADRMIDAAVLGCSIKSLVRDIVEVEVEAERERCIDVLRGHATDWRLLVGAPADVIDRLIAAIRTGEIET